MISQVVMRETYKQLAARERDLLAVMLAKGTTKAEIARSLGRHRSTISREIERNGPRILRNKYLPHKAQERSEKRRSESREVGTLRDSKVREYVEKKLKGKWSPEIIAGRLNREAEEVMISHETIYRWIYKDAPEYKKYLARGHAKRWEKKRNKRAKKIHIPNRVSIHDRPEEVESRIEIGHWEADTMVVKKRGPALQVVVERTSRVSRLRKIVSMQSKESNRAVIKSLKREPDRFRKSITYDNGKENVQHTMVNRKLDTESYFCDPYCGWQKGTVENTIGLIRRFYPKRKVDISKFTDRKIKQVENWLNNRPRKCLGFLTPYEVYMKSVALTL